jgi:penicillin-binding protein 1A
MAFSRKRRVVIEILIALGVMCALAIGVGLGLAIATTRNLQRIESIGEQEVALPSKILDREGRLITEFFSDEKREIVAIDEIPKHLIYALLTREDQSFFEHQGFSVRGTLRAAWNIATGQYFSGASTITQQLAGNMYADRTDISVRRKLVELWWAFQLERRLTKNEILEMYLNRVPFGHNTQGVEAASKFYFGHSVRDMTLAESAMLVIQLARPGLYSPIRNPNRAAKIQREVLDQMVDQGYVSRQEADVSYQQYWLNYDSTRSNTTTAYFEREDKAPWFSEYIREQLDEIMLGALDINRDGFVVHTTLDLDYQEDAKELTAKLIRNANVVFQNQSGTRQEYVDQELVPLVEMLALGYNIPDVRIAGTKQRQDAEEYLKDVLNPAVDLVSLMFDMPAIKSVSNQTYAEVKQEAERSTVEGAMITLQNGTGHILAMVGGSDFGPTNQFNRAVKAQVMPGSSFKPLYYSAAIGSRKFTPATLIYDGPVAFWNDDGSPYTPLNYKGEWTGHVLLRTALKDSMNVPSVKVLDGIGFDAAIDRAAALLGYTDPVEIARNFPRKYPLGLGIVRVSPIRMATAYSTFPNQGRRVEPLSIRYIEDRDGRLIKDVEKEHLAERRRDENQIMSPQTAYVMVDLLKSTVQSGTLEYARKWVGGFDDMPIAGKTGTTDNWSDAWTVGFSPYVTTAFWVGFDKPGHSLGVQQTGAVTTGPIWAQFMERVHRNMPAKEFSRPETGLVEMEVCSVSGLLPTEYCHEGTHTEIFLAGTEPKRFCDIHEYEQQRTDMLVQRLQDSMLGTDLDLEFRDIDIIDESDVFIADEFDFDFGFEEEEPEAETGNPLLD